jgi:hypothetical protein
MTIKEDKFFRCANIYDAQYNFPNGWNFIFGHWGLELIWLLVLGIWKFASFGKITV